MPGFAERRRDFDPEELPSRRSEDALFDEAISCTRASRNGSPGQLKPVGLDNLSGNEPQRALRAAQALQQAARDARGLADGGPAIGIAQGALLPTRMNGPFPLTGDPMTDAEAQAGRARPGEILLSDELRRALGTRNAPFAGRHAELALMTSLLERTIATRRGPHSDARRSGMARRACRAQGEAARARGADSQRAGVDFGQVKARRPLAGLFASLLGVGGMPIGRARSSVADEIASGRLTRGSTCTQRLIGRPLSPPGIDRAAVDARRSSTDA